MTDGPWRFSVATLAVATAVGAALVLALGSTASESLRLQKGRRDIDVARALTRRLISVESGAAATDGLDAAPTLSSAQQHGIESIVLRTRDGVTILATDDLGPSEIAAFGAAQDLEITTPTMRLVRSDELRTDGSPAVYLHTITPLRDSDAEGAGTLEVKADADDLIRAVTHAWMIVTRNVVLVLGASWALVVGLAWLSFLHRKRRLAGAAMNVADAPYPSPTATRTPLALEHEIKSAFIATISHEIRTPINAVVGMAELLKLTDLTRKQTSYVQYIQSSCDMLLSLVENVIDFSRLEAGTHTLHMEEFDVVDLVERVLGIMGYPAYSKGLELSAVLRHDLGLRVSADRHRLCQILINLVGNSVKFTDAGLITIDVSSEECQGEKIWLRFEVADTGHGIDASVRERLFVPFVSSKRQASKRHEGSGLGLAICKQLIDVMGGSIDIASSVGIGTRVTVKVPATERRSSYRVAARLPESGAPANRVLITHSNRVAGANIGELLQRSGVDCELAATSDDMLEQLRASFATGPRFDKLILDADLTPADGLMLARSVRSDETCGSIPIVLLNSIVRPLEVGDVSRIGGLSCIDKPVLPLTLLKNVRHHVEPFPLTTASGAETGARAESLKILVAEDNAVNIRLLLSMLTAAGYDADAARDAPAVFAAMERTAYDVVLMDGRMPGMDGHRITEIIRANPGRFASQPVMIAVTAEATEEYRAECLAMGMDDFITKPIRLDELRACFRRWTGKRTGSVARSPELDDRASIRRRIIDRVGYRDEPRLRQYIGLFLFDTNERLERLVLAAEQGDTEAVNHECHAIKGACLDLGAERMVRLCDRLIVAARSESTADIDTAVRGLLKEFKRLRPIYESATVVVH